MARVATNQDQDETERAHYVYVQHARVTSKKGKRIQCEEVTDIRIAPAAKGSHQQLLKLDGRVLDKDKYLTYTRLLPDQHSPEPSSEPSDSITIQTGQLDRGLVESMRNGLTNDKAEDSKDGISANLFPLTSKRQADYAFHLIGREHMNGREVFHIAFGPKDKHDFGWKGDAFVDTTAYQPVAVSTTMNRKLPFAVRTLMGTNLPGLGFTVVYAPQPDGLWFPVSFSTEFKIHVLFFFNREVIIDARNQDFEKTHVTSEVVAEETPSH